MAFSSQFESKYIREFAGIVRHGTTPLVWSEWVQRIRNALSKIADPKARAEAQERFTRISSYAAILSEDPAGSRNLVADELEKLAAFMSDKK